MQNFAIVINKQPGFTSRDVVNQLCKIFATKKVGHTGTLDPMASGVLICLVGKYTKLVDLITANEKEYIATIKLGISTDTLDITGKVLKEESPLKLDINTISDVLKSFVGEYEQTIPIYSAHHVNGKRLYEYARSNMKVELPKNKVTIKDIELLNYENAEITFKVLVSKGTYIRSLIQSICTKLNCLGVMSKLIRTKQGSISIDNAYTLGDIINNKYQVLKLNDLLSFEEIELNEELYKKVINGNEINLSKKGYVLFKKDNIEIALYYFENNVGKLKILFN